MLQKELQAANGENKVLLRLITCGSAGDGKSTLMGRLLHDIKFIFDDQRVEPSKARDDDIDFASLLNRLEGAQEQGTTIDVTHRQFSTARRSFILADIPGHEQFTRNTAVGASDAQLAIIVINARGGFVTQTRRHVLICSLLGIRHVVVAVNKIDLVNFDKDAFDRVVAEFKSATAGLDFSSIVAIPISARYGDNVARLSDRTAWYRGPTLLGYLEEVDVQSKSLEAPFRFPVQSVDRVKQDSPALLEWSSQVASHAAIPLPSPVQVNRPASKISSRMMAQEETPLSEAIRLHSRSATHWTLQAVTSSRIQPHAQKFQSSLQRT